MKDCNCTPWNTIPLSQAQAMLDAGLRHHEERLQRRERRTAEEKLLDDLESLLSDMRRDERRYAQLCKRAAAVGYVPITQEMIWENAADVEARIANLKLDIAIAQGVNVEDVEEAARERR